MLQITEVLKLAVGEKITQESKNYISSRPTRFLDSMPPVVVWNINNTCNMSCPHCYSSASKKPDKEELTTEEAFNVIDKLKDYGIKILIFSGGEPLLRKDIFSLIEKARSYNIVCHLSTNGVLITEDVAQKLKELSVQYVGISIDGLEKFNDTYRGLKNGYYRAILGLSHIHSAGLQTGIRTTVTKKNYKDLFSLIDIAIQNNINRFYISHLVYGGRGKEFSKYDLSKDDVASIMLKVFEKSLEYIQNKVPISIVSGGNDADGVLLYQYIQNKFGDSISLPIYEILKKRNGNSAGERIINIDHKGEIHPDQFWRSISFGNILSYSLLEIMNHPIAIQLKDRTKYLKGKCKECKYIEICRGSHRERAEFIHGDIWEEDPACYIE